MLHHYMNQKGYCFPSISTIAKAARLNERTVRRHLNEAMKQGWIRRRFRSPDTSYASLGYWAQIPAGVKLPVKTRGQATNRSQRPQNSRAPSQSQHPQNRPRAGSSDAEIDARGRRLRVQPRRGESYPEYLTRIYRVEEERAREQRFSEDSLSDDGADFES